jgi:hypothetical protein
MMPRRISAIRVKANRNYTVEEAADVAGATPQTVRAWIKRGLPAMNGQRPVLILGSALKEFLARAEADRKRPLQVGEFFCLGCKSARAPALAMADYVALSANHGFLRAFCAVCEGPCTRVVSAAALPAWRAISEIDGTNDGAA